MSRRDSSILRAAAVWTFFIWAVFVRNLLRDASRSTGFKLVHLTLAVVSCGFAVALLRVASKGRRHAGETTRR